MRKPLIAVWSIFILWSIFSGTGCKRKEVDPVITPVPMLTGRTWLADTIVVAPPLLFSQLSVLDQQNLINSNAFFKTASIRLNENGTVTTGNWDFGFTRWRLINNKMDIEMEKGDGTVRVLRNWQVSATQFYYTITMGAYEVIYKFK